MTVNRTTLLNLPLPVTGTESGTWGDTTNNGLTQYIDIAVAGMTSLTSSDFTAGALSLSNSTGDSSATNIAASSAQYGAIKVSSLAATSTITAPSSNRRYVIINADATYNLIIKASGQTGVTVVPGEKALVAFNGTDYVKVGGAAGGSTTQVQYNNAGVLAGSANFTFDGSNVGIGVTPTASSNTGILQNQGGILFAFSNTFQDLSQNAYYNGGYKYTNSNFATLYRQNGGTHQWFNSASGTAGNAITFTQAMTLDASGNLLIGNTTDPIGGNRVLVQSAATANNNRTFTVYNSAASSTTAFANRIAQLSSLGSGADVTLHFTDQTQYNGFIGMGSGNLYFATNGTTERARIDNGGNLLVGTTVAPGVNGGGIAIYKSDYPRLTFRNSTSGDTSSDGLQMVLVGADFTYNLLESGYQRWTTAGVERARITSGGDVGIGTSSPLARLTVSDSTTTNGTMTLGDNASYNGTLQYIFSTGELRISQVGGGSLGTTFYTAGSERMRITSAGVLTAAAASTVASNWPTGTSQIFNLNGATYAGISFGDPERAGAANRAAVSITAWSGGGSNYYTSKLTTIGDGTLTFSTQATASTDAAGTSTERMRIDSSGNVGIGETSPGTRLDVKGNGVPLTINSANSNANKVQFEDNGTVKAYFGTTSFSGVVDCCFQASDSSGNTRFSVVAASGTIGLNTQPATTGTGITFPATQSASSDANTLDDYEEGDWTPSIGGNATYGGDTGGRYVKVGKVVTVWGKIQITTKGTGSATTISGLPFTSANLGLESSGSTTYYANLAVNVITPQAVVPAAATTVQFYSATSAGTGSGGTLSIFGDSSRIYFTVTYETST